jgi:chromosomal replication initiator protein
MQEELFIPSTPCTDANKQMVFTCGPSCLRVKNLEIVSAAGSKEGWKGDLLQPNYEPYSILKKKSESTNLRVPPEVTDIIAKNFSTNVRDLEAALMK